MKQSLKVLKEGKGFTLNIGGGAKNKDIILTRDIVEEKRTGAEQEDAGFDFEGKKIKGEPTIEAESFPGTEGNTITQTGRDDLVITWTKSKSKTIDVPDGKLGSEKTIIFDGLRFLKDDKGELHVLGRVPAGQKVWLPAGTKIVKDGFEETTEEAGYERSQKSIEITRPFEEIEEEITPRISKEEFEPNFKGATLRDVLKAEGMLPKTGGEPAPAPEAPTEGRKKFNAATGKLE